MNRCVQSLVVACLGRSMFGAIPEAVEEQVAGHQDELTLRTTGHSVTLRSAQYMQQPEQSMIRTGVQKYI